MRATRRPRLLFVWAASGMLMSTVALCASAAPPPALTGPLSDFWPKVRHDWSERIPSLNHGDDQTFLWVPIIWDGPDDRAFTRLIDRLRVRERHNWLRTGATEHRWRDIEDRKLARLPFMRQNCILIGTPRDNALVARALAATPLKVDEGLVAIEGRVIRGENLLVIAIVPNPVHPSSYALVFTGSSGRALLRADRVPYGETDYIVFAGEKVVERGSFEWKSGAPRGDRLASSQSFTPHLTWQVVDSRHARLHHDPAATPAARLASIGRRLDEGIEQTAAFLGIGQTSIPDLDIYLYGSLDEKIAQTGDTRISHVDPADGTLHAVLAPGGDPPEPALVALILLDRAGGIWARTEPSDLPGLKQALSLACRDSFEGIPLSEWASRSSRDAGWLPMDRLFYRDPRDLESGDLDLLDAAAFLRDLIAREGIDKVARYYRAARRSTLSESFRSIFGIFLGMAESRWLSSLPADATRRSVRTVKRQGTGAPPSAQDPALAAAREAFQRREEGRAERLLTEMTPTAATRTLLARLCFRSGRFDEAAAHAREALADPGASPDDRAWARLTLGRALAVSGRRVAAVAQLRDGDISSDSGQPRILADYWLETMGMPLNQRAAHQVIVSQARVELTNWNWEAAEEKLQVVLAADPGNRQAHALLGQVYLSKYSYWRDFALLDRELFPGSELDPEMYRNLALKGRTEVEIASKIPADRGETLAGGAQQEEINADDPANPGWTPMQVGKARLLAGDIDSAVHEFEEAIATPNVRPNLAAYCHLYLGRIAARRGDHAGARAHFAAIVDLRANASVTALARQEIRKLASAAGSR